MKSYILKYFGIMHDRDNLPASVVKKFTKYLINTSLDFPSHAKVLLELK